MKKIMMILLVSLLGISIAACGSSAVDLPMVQSAGDRFIRESELEKYSEVIELSMNNYTEVLNLYSEIEENKDSFGEFISVGHVLYCQLPQNIFPGSGTVIKVSERKTEVFSFEEIIDDVRHINEEGRGCWPLVGSNYESMEKLEEHEYDEAEIVKVKGHVVLLKIPEE
ncbi:MAG: hypothetical protein IJ115_01870 [Erysipelotrichaceae bacterium]|nr:hypothetical protein [Erysipelotrichaceae bacterium]